MSLSEDPRLRSISGISIEERQRIEDFLQGAIYCWCKNRKDEWFSLRDLMGGDNHVWNGTPLQPLYNKHNNKKADPVKEAGKDGGWLLKAVISNDRRKFQTKKENLVRKYRWNPGQGST